MELKDFIEQSVSDIVDAIQCLKIKYNSLPEERGITVYEENPIAPNISASKEEKIEFDIAVTSTQSSETEKSGGVKIKVIDGVLGKKDKDSNENLTRIKFSIPFFPKHIRKNDTYASRKKEL